MEITPTTIILVGVVCVVLGFIASVLLNTLRDETEVPAEGSEETPPGGKKGGYTAITRLWRERKAGSLVVEMDGKAYVSPEALDSSQRERLEQVARDLRGWLGMGLAGSESARVGAPSVTAASEPPENLPDIDLNRALGVSAAPPPPVTPTPAPRQQPVRPQAQPRPTPPAPAAKGKSPTPGGKEELPVEAPVSKSIVMQIEDILQDMIAGTPLAQRGVHLIEDPLRGVIVKVGLETYEGIDSVTDPEVRNTIRAAVQEWEKTQ